MFLAELRRVADDVEHELARRVGEEGRRALGGLDEDDAEAPPVERGRRRLAALAEELGRHVLDGAREGPLPPLRRAAAAALRGGRRGLGVVVDALGEPKVAEVRVAGAVEEDVRALDVAVEDVPRVEVGEAQGELRDDEARRRPAEAVPVAPQRALQRVAHEVQILVSVEREAEADEEGVARDEADVPLDEGLVARQAAAVGLLLHDLDRVEPALAEARPLSSKDDAPERADAQQLQGREVAEADRVAPAPRLLDLLGRMWPPSTPNPPLTMISPSDSIFPKKC